MTASFREALPDLGPLHKMAFDLLDAVLLASKDLNSLAARIAEKLRDLTGAQTVLVVQNLEPFAGHGFRALSVCPKRNTSVVREARTRERLEQVLGQREVVQWANPAESGMVTLGIPLVNAEDRPIAVILLQELPGDAQRIEQLCRCLNFLGRYLSELLGSALVRSFQEDLITQRTNELWQEIVERKAVEKVLRKSRDEWEKTFDAMPDVVTLLDSDMRIIKANRAALDLLGFEVEQILGRQCSMVFSGLDCPCPGCPVPAARMSLSAHSHEMNYPKLNKTFTVSTVPILDDQGLVSHFIHIAKDITDRIRLEEELLQSQKLEAVGTLAGGIAHDFNNILSAIIGYSEIIKMGLPASSQLGDDVDEIIRAGKRAADLIKQILTFSRKDSATIEIFEPHLIISESLKMLRSSLPVTVEIAGEIRHDCGYVKANPTRLHQIMVNLCTNAVHAMEKEKGILTVNLSRVDVSRDMIGKARVSPGPFVLLSVADTGSGMDKDVMERIFEPYFTTKAVGRGTGLGLAVVHGIVRDARGFARVDSSPGEGSVFNIYLPAENVSDQTRQEVGSGNLPTGNEHILIVDDENAITQVNRSMLESLGYRTTTEGDSRRALDMFMADPGRFDLVLTDQTMPGLTGSELARAMLQQQPDLPIILCTGYSSVMNEEEALAIGIRSYVLKPVARDNLARKVREALDNQVRGTRDGVRGTS